MSDSSFNHQFYDTAPVSYTVKLPKICELCGQNFYRIVGSEDKYCLPCHMNWNQAVSVASSTQRPIHHLTQGAKYADGGQDHGNKGNGHAMKVCPVATHNPKGTELPRARAGSGAKTHS